MTTTLQLIDPQTLHAHLTDPTWVILDVGRAAVYAQVHLPQARWVDRAALMSGHPDALGSLPDLARLQQMVEQLGLQLDQHIVVYDDKNFTFFQLNPCSDQIRTSISNHTPNFTQNSDVISSR